MRNRTLLLILISAVALTVAINAAEEAKPAEILLSAFPLSIPADGKSTSLITATIPEATATTMADTNTVKFTTTLGTIEPAGEIKNGIAQVLLRSGLVPGIAMVTATYRNMTNTINVHFGRKPKFFLYLNRNAQFVPADNSSTVIIEALIASENAFVPDGTVVTFRADHGKVTPLATTMGGRAIAVLTTDTFVGPVKVIAQCESLKADTPSIEFIQPKIKGIRLWTPTLKVPADGISTATVTAFIIGPDNEPLCMPGIPLTFEATEGLIKSVNLFTDIGGSARTVVGPSRVPGKVIVTATSGEFKDSIEVEFIKLKSPALIEMLQGFPVETYGKDYTVCRIVAIVKDKVDNSVGPGVEVKFSASQGFITPLKRTDEKGIAVAHLIFPGTKGTVKVDAVSGKVKKDLSITFPMAKEKTIRYRLPEKISINLTPLLPLEKASNGMIKCKVQGFFEDTTGMRLPGGVVTFRTTAGTITPPIAVIDSNGVAEVELSFPETEHKVLVIADVGKSSQSISVEAPGEPKRIEFKLLPPVIAADGKSRTLVSVFFKDEKGKEMRVPFGLTIASTNGTIVPWGIPVPGCLWETYYLVSSNIPGVTIITATCGSVEGKTQVIFASEPATVALFAHPKEFTAGSSAYIKAVIKDQKGNPVPDGTPVNFSTSHGIITEQSTTFKGEAIVVLTCKEPGTCLVVANCGMVSNSVLIPCRPAESPRT